MWKGVLSSDERWNLSEESVYLLTNFSFGTSGFWGGMDSCQEERVVIGERLKD